MCAERRHHVLIVDDDRHLLVELRDYLTFEGFDVTVAESAEVGIERIESSPPDIILLDISMPGMGGVGFLRRITGDDGHPRYPVLVFTARSAMKSFFESIDVRGFIEKPCDLQDLVARIREVLAQSRTSRPGHALRTVLLGEDDAEVADPLAEALKAANYEVLIARTGPEVIEKAAAGQPHLILLKQILSRMNGSAVAAVVRTMPMTRETPIILYDADATLTARDVSRMVRAAPGLNRCLTTDDPAELLRAVRTFLP